MAKHKLVITKGELKAIYTPELLSYAECNGAEVRRATRVEPDNWLLRFVFRQIRNCVSDESRAAAWTRKWPCRWRADLGLSGGPVIGPFQTRDAAVEAELKWLVKHWLQQERKPDACIIKEGRRDD